MLVVPDLQFYSMPHEDVEPEYIRSARGIHRAKIEATLRNHTIVIMEERYLYRRGTETVMGICYTRYFRIKGKWCSPDNELTGTSFEEMMRGLSQ